MSIALFLAAALAAGTPQTEPMLGQTDLDPALVLPAPPAPGSVQARLELEELHAVEAARSPADEAAARSDSATKDASIFREAVGPRFDLARLPATAHLFAIVRATEKAAADRGKTEFLRQRPWIVDPSLRSCSRDDDDRSSYPSGHTTMAYAMAGVLARLLPGRAPAILARAARYGESRMVCEVHFRSDVTAGEALGLLVAERLMAKAEFRAAFDAARVELISAGIG